MVIILQQSTDNGKRFVSTVVADEEASFNSNFSLNSENSISERSAIYKQRIDSLFGRQTGQTKTTKGPSGKSFDGDHHMGEKVNGTQGDKTRKPSSSASSSDSSTSSSSSSASCSSSSSPVLLQFQQTSHSSLSTSSLHSTAVWTAAAASSSGASAIAERKVLFSQETQATIIFSEEDDIETKQQVRNKRFTKRRDRQYTEGKILEEDEIVPEPTSEHGYERVLAKSCPSSVVTDSLNQSASSDFSKYLDEDDQETEACNHHKTCQQSVFKGLSQNVSFLNVRSDQKNQPHPKATDKVSNPKLSPLRIQTQGVADMSESHMWRNGCAGSGNDDRQVSIVRSSPGGILRFPVEYLGSIPVQGNTTALQDLQAPLRNLYFNFLTGTNTMDGDLAITADGLRFEAPKVRLVNPFTTIAVWAAIKFVTRDGMDCAFMPLISDPEGQDKGRLYGKMNPELIRAYRNCINGRSSFRNPPIFACVMREASFALDCHAFVCKCAEDAIVIAANLYQSLVDKMRSSSCSSSSSNASANSPTAIGNGQTHIKSCRKGGESGYGSLNRNSPPNQSSPTEIRSSSSASSQASPANHNCKPVTSALRLNHSVFQAQSSTSSGSATSSADETHNGVRCNNSCPPGPSQVRHHNGNGSKLLSTAKGKEKDLRVVFSDSESLVPVRPPRKKKKSPDGYGYLKRYGSDDSVLLKMPPRRRSFKASKNGVKKRVQISTPDDLTSSEQSINKSIDQVLDRIVHPGGMSFNDLKPGYQQLLLKIALTLTQDQLYQKSKQAMRKHQQSRTKKLGLQKTLSDSSDDSQFLNLLMKSFSKITSGKNPQASKESRVSKTSKSKGQFHPKGQLRKPHSKMEDTDPFMSFCSGCICDKCSEKCYCSLPSKQQKSVGFHPEVGCHKGKEYGACASEGLRECGGSRKKPCGYDTDSCAESEKCYCSLQRVKSNGLKIYNINLDTETSDTDTNSYDFEPFNHDDTSKHTSCSNLNTVSAHSVEILSYNPQSTTKSRHEGPRIQTTSAMVHFQNEGDLDNGETSPSIPTKYAILKPNTSFLHSKPLSPQMVSESSTQMQRNKVLLITGSTPSTRVMYQPPQQVQRQRTYIHGLDDVNEVDDNATPREVRKRSKKGNSDFGAERIISMKKTAEIAAMFSDLKLEHRNHMPELQHDGSDSSPSTEESSNVSLDLEASLGYLP